jgi:predicted permease
MLSHFLKTTWRSFRKNKAYSLLNIFGLAVGMACAALIFLWVEDELHFDQFHVKKDQLYLLRENQKYDTYTATFWSTPAPMAPAMQSEIPGIARTCRMAGGGTTKLITIGDRSVYASGGYVDPSFFQMLTFPFIRGNAHSVFDQLHSMVITEETAKKFFGTSDHIIGKTVRVDNTQDYVITGVVKNVPKNSTIQFEWLSPFQIWWDANKSWAQSWGNNDLTTFVELKPHTQPASVNKLLYNFIQAREPKSIARPFLWSAHDWHLRDEFDNGVPTGGGRITYVHLFSVIAWIILLIACINFMNLATARSEKRAREVGVRKVLGSAKRTLIFQFIGESLLMSTLSALLAVLLVSLLLPSFNSLVEKQLTLGLTHTSHILAIASVTILCGLIAGSYPALYLSSFNPIGVLKGIITKGQRAALIRKVLVVFQFSLSILFIISTLIVYQQIQHVKSRDLGFNRNNLLQVDMNQEMAKNYTAIRQDLLKARSVESVALSNYNTLEAGNNTGSITWEGKPSDNQVLISIRYVSPGFMKTTGIHMLAGRDFVETDSAQANLQAKNVNAIITQSLANLMGGKNVVGKTLRWGDDNHPITIHVVGIVNNYIYGNMYGKPDPVLFFCVNTPDASNMYVRLRQKSDLSVAIKQIGAVLAKDNPSYPFTYHFVDDEFNRFFQNEQLIGKISRLFAGLAVLISCLGLFGLAAYSAERRTKEMGIRKILGASAFGVATLLSKDFLKLVILSCIVAFPIAWWVMHKWLQQYTYRIEISWWTFIAAGLSAILIALITISFQSTRAAMANPVKSLRTE